MLFTWSTENLCIVFESWHITGTFSLIWSLLAIVALGAGYELVRNITRQYEARVANRLENMPRKLFILPGVPDYGICTAIDAHAMLVGRVQCSTLAKRAMR
jgi:hypothetical protein